MKRRAVETKNCDRVMMLRAADSFLQHSSQFTDALPEDLEQAGNAAAMDSGGLIASATFLALATELYLKLLLTFSAANIEQDHRLWDTFTKLSPEIKQIIEKEFNDRYAKTNQVLALELRRKTPDPPPRPIPDTPQDPKKDLNLESILRKSNDAFVAWRYLYEKGGNTGQVFLSYEFSGLRLLCEILGGLAETAFVMVR